MALKKFCYAENESQHWNYCKIYRVPYVCIRSSMDGYWNLSFDTLAVMPDRPMVIEIMDHLDPLYQMYCTSKNFPAQYKESGGSNRSGWVRVYAPDSEDLAEKLYDLLELLMKMEDQRFSEDLLDGRRNINLS